MPYLNNTNVVVDLMKHIVALKNYIIVQCVLTSIIIYNR